MLFGSCFLDSFPFRFGCAHFGVRIVVWRRKPSTKEGGVSQFALLLLVRVEVLIRKGDFFGGMTNLAIFRFFFNRTLAAYNGIKVALE